MSNVNQKQWATDVIGEDYKSWANEVVLLGLGTGRGKTTFALSKYCRHLIAEHKSVIYLCNRTQLLQQIVEEAKKLGIEGKIKITTYQAFQTACKSGNNAPHYDVYICDEAHYFLADSQFNTYTDIAYNKILAQNNSVRVFMTATNNNIFTLIKENLKINCNKKGVEYTDPKEYMLPTSYSHVDKIVWFEKPGEIYSLIDTILRTTEEDKILYFCNSISMMNRLYTHYSPYRNNEKIEKKEEYINNSSLKYMKFHCSEHSKSDFAKNHSDSEAIVEGGSGGYTFESRVLVTTKCVDNGVDFKDKKIRHVICDVFDTESAIQCLGRKRVLDSEDHCVFYIRNWQSYSVKAFLTNIHKELEPVDLYMKDYTQFVEKYGTDRDFNNKIMYSNFKKDEKGLRDVHINYLKYRKFQREEYFIKNIINKSIAYKDYILACLDWPFKNEVIKDTKQSKIKDAVEIFLEMHKEQQMNKNLQKEFIEICDLKDGFGRGLKSIGAINSYLESFKYGYKIESKRISNDGERETIWIIHKES